MDATHGLNYGGAKGGSAPQRRTREDRDGHYSADHR